MNKERKNSSGIVKRTFAMMIIVLMVSTVFGSASFIFNTPEPMVDENVDVPDISPISEDLDKALEDAGYEDYFAPEVEEITHDYSTPKQDHASDEVFGSNELEQESRINKPERMEPPLAEDDLRYTGTQTRENPGLAYCGVAPEEATFGAASESWTSPKTGTESEMSSPEPPIVHVGPDHPGPSGLTILLVDDDATTNNGGVYGPPPTNRWSEDPTYGTPNADALTALGESFDIFVVPAGADGPPLALIEGYDALIWVTGYEWGFYAGYTLSGNDQNNLAAYLDGGGMVWLESTLGPNEYVGWALGGQVSTAPGSLLYDYFDISDYACPNPSNIPNPLTGEAGSIMDGAAYATAPHWSDPWTGDTDILGNPGSAGIFTSGAGGVPFVGTQYDSGSFRTVFTGLPLAFMSNAAEQEDKVERILSFFNPTADYGCTIDPDFSAQDTTPSSQVDYLLNITNIGTAQPMDLFDLTYISFPFGWTVEFFEDDGVTPLTDNSGDGNPDTNVLATLDWIHIIARVTVPPGALGGDMDTAILTARSFNNPLYFTQAILETTVPPYGVEFDQTFIDGWCREDNWNDFNVIVRNTAGFPDTFDLTSFSPMGWPYTFYEADGVTLLVDTGGTPDVDTGIIPPLSDMMIKIRVDVALGNPPGTIDNAIIDVTSVGDPLQVAILDLSIFVTYEVIYFEDVEAGEDDYTHYAMEGGPDTWVTSAARSYQGANSWYSGVEGTTSLIALESPYIFVPNIQAVYAKLDFWHWHDFQDASGFFSYPDCITDGAIVECYDAGSQSWTYIMPDDEVLGDYPGYTGRINDDYSNPLGGIEGYGLNNGGWEHEYFDILNYLSTGPLTGTVVNESVYGPSLDGDTGPLFLDNGNIIDCTMYIDLAGSEWLLLQEGADYFLNYDTGEIDTSPIEPYEAGWTFFAWYNYSAGNALKFRWSVGTDTVNWASEQWYIDNIRVRIPMFGSVITPEYQEKLGFAGTDVTYDFDVENIGYQGTDDFNLEYQGIWPATLYDSSWTPAATTGPMIPGEVRSFHLNVSVPGAAVGGDFDDVLIWSNSTLDPFEQFSARILTSVPYEPPWTDPIDIPGLWTTSSGALWHIEGSRFNSPPTCWAYNNGINYDTGAQNFGSLYSPWVNLPAGRSYAEFSWWEWREVEAGPWDVSTVSISTDGNNWDQLYQNDASVGTWTKRTYDISSYIGSVVKFQFFFDTLDGIANAFEGWFVDDVEVLCPAYGALWTPASQSSFGDPTDIKTYDMDLTNVGEYTDTFTFTTTTTLGWPVTVYNDTWAVVADSGVMDSGTTKSFHANVTIPVAALTTDTETTIITATSTIAPAYFADTTLTTFVLDAILLVSDDNTPIATGGGYMGPEYCALLNVSLGGPFYDWIEVSMMGQPSFESLQAHDMVIWHTQGVGATYPWGGWDTTNPLDASERTIIGQYLDGGGLMYMSGAGPVAAFFQGYAAWYSQYFGMTGTHWWPWGAPPFNAPIDGIVGNPISDGIVGVMYGPAYGSCIGEGATCSGGADGAFDVAFVNPLDGYCAGTTLNSGGQKRVSTTFDLANVDNGGGVQQLIMDRILAFLDPDVGIVLTPQNQDGIGTAGLDITYNLNIFNDGKNPDNFNLAQVGGVWPAATYDLGWNPIVATGWLNPDESIDIYINVSVPGAAIEGDLDTTIIRVTSTVDGAIFEDATIVTSIPFNPPWFDDMESGAPGWSYTGGGTGAVTEWHLNNNNPYSPVSSWYWGQNGIWQYDPGPVDGKLLTPWVVLTAGCMYAEMNVWHDYDFEAMWDGGVVDITTDGVTWQRLTPVDGYDGVLLPGFGNVLEGQDAFTGDTGGYVNDVFDLSVFIGNTVKLRFWAGADSFFMGDEGWYVDDITIICPEYGCQWIPEAQSVFGSQGDVMTYSMDLRNIGRFQDTYTFTTTTTLGWPVDVYDDAWNPVVDSGALDPGWISSFYANVTVPLAALGSDTETTIITATSTLDPSYWANETLTTFVLDPVLLVSDDLGHSIDDWYKNALDNNDFGGFYSYDWIDIATMGTPSLEAMQAHQIVIWHCVGVGGDTSPWGYLYEAPEPLDANERNLIGQYLDGGGLMYIASGGLIVSSLWNGYTAWTDQYVGVLGQFWYPFPLGNAGQYAGIAGNPVGDGLSLTYHDGTGHPDCLGEGVVGPMGGAFDAAFEDPATGNIAGTTLDTGTERRVFTSFDLADISGANNRDLLMMKILTFLLPPPYALSITPSYQSGYAFAGDTVTYGLNITNIGTNDDIYDIFVGLGPMGWITNVFEEDGVTPLTDNGGIPGEVDTGIVLVGGYYNIVVEVQVDVLAIPGDIDTADIVAESFGGGGDIAVQALIDTMIPNLILLVDDDDSINNGGPYNTYAVEDASQPVGTPYADALTALGYDYDLYVVPSGADGPDPETLASHPIVIWLCGYEWGWAPSLTSEDQNNLATFLDNGGKLWLNGPMIIYDFFGFGGPTSVSPGSFFYDYLKISDTYINTNLPPNPLVGDPASIFAGASYGAASVWPTSWTGEVNILPLADSLGGFASPSATLPYSANTYEDGNYQMCYLEVEFAFITAAADKSDCAWRILNWMMPNEGVSLTPDYQSWYGSPGSFVWYNMTVKNTGFGGPDSFDMTYVSPMGWTYDFFESDLVTPLVDTDGTLIPDTGPIGSYATRDIAVRVTIPGAAMGGDIDLGTITATSFNNPAVFDDATVETICYVPGQDYKAVYISYAPEADTGAVATLWQDDFEDGDISDWTLVGAQNDWQVGTPAGLGLPADPVGAANGVFSIGNDLTGLGAVAGEYENGLLANGNYIYSPAINCVGFTGVTLEFERWFGVESAVFDHASIQVSNDGAVWNMVWDHTGGSFSDAAWSTYSYDISGIADNQPTVYVRFDMGPTDASVTYCGWNLDDVRLTANLPAVESDQLLYNTAMWTGDTGGNVRLGIVDSWGTDNQAAWLAWAAGHLDVDVAFIDKDPFTYGDLIASGADALVISHASSREYSADEIAAIQQYSFDGHGLIGTGGSMDFGVPNNVNLGPLFGLAIGFQPWSVPFTEYTMDDPLHPVMAGLPDPFSPGSAYESCTMMILDGAVQLAHIDTVPTGMITAYERDTIPPTFAGIQTCTDLGTGGTLDLGWFPATDPAIPITYNIYQAFASGGQNFAAPTYTTTLLNYQVTGLVNGIEYFYVVRAEDAFGNEDTNTVELSAIPTQRMFFQVQTPGIPGYQNLSMETFEATLQTHMTDVAAPGQYLVGNVGWMTEAYVGSKDLSGTWTFHMWAYITDPAITGDLYIRCYNYSAAPVAMLFETGKSELVDGHTGWYEFIWNYDVPVGTVTQPGESIFLELWIDATAGGVTTPLDQDVYVVSFTEILGTVDAGTFINAQDDLDGDWATLREAGVAGIDVDTYVTSNTDTLGTTNNLIGAQSDADGGDFAILTEENTGGAGGPVEYYADTMVSADPGVVNPNNAIDVPDDAYAIIDVNNEYVRVSGSTWGMGSGTITQVEVVAEWNSIGLLDDLAFIRYWDLGLGAYGPTNFGDATNYAADNTYYMDITADKVTWAWADIGDIQPELVYDQVAGPDGATINLDALWIRVTTVAGDNYQLRIEFTTSGIPVTAVYTLELNYQTTGEAFDVFVWDGGVWNDRGDLNSMLWSTWSYSLLPAEVIAGEVRVQYRGQNEVGDPIGDDLNIEYHRVNAQSAGTDYRMEIQFDTTGIPFAETYTLEIYYQVSAEPIQVWIYNYTLGGFWEQITTLNSAAWVAYQYVVPPDQISAGEVLVRYIDDVPIPDAVEDTIDIEYHRVNAFTVGGTPSQIVLGYDFAARPSGAIMALNPYDPAGPVTTNVLAVPNPTNGVNIVTLTANVSDLGYGDNNIVATEYFVDVIGADGTGIGMAPQDGAFNEPEEDVTSTIDITAWPDGIYTIYVHGQDAFGNWGACNSTILNKTSMYQQLFMPGWILMSIPYEPADTAITSVLSTITGDYDYVQYYDASDPADPWKTYATFKPPSLNDLTDIHNTMGIWINILNPCVLTVYGYEPTSTTIDLYAGWNLVGYPARDDSSYNVTQLKADTGATMVDGFNATAPYRISTLSDDYNLTCGEGYWVKMPFDSTWIVDW